MPSERTPLIQTVPVGPPRQRYPHHTIRRIFTVVLSVACFVVLILFLWPGALKKEPLGGGHDRKAWPHTQGIDYAELQHILLGTPNEDKARSWSQYYAAGPHLAGKNLSQAEWTRDRWQEFGVAATTIVAYDTYINYPKDHRLALLETSKKASETSVKYECSLEEDVLAEDSTSGLADRVPTFHGYSASGNVTARFVYVNYGRYEDFEDLKKLGVQLEGKIAIAKYGGVFRGLKVKRAQELGMVGCVIYSDPGDDGEVTEENGHKAYPHGPARQPSSVERGSVQYISDRPGDPTTPGYPSKPGAPRQPVDDVIPKIPSLPISYQDAVPLLKALNGHGPAAESINDFWRGGGLRHKGVKYNVGPSPPELTLNLVNEQEYVITPLWDVIGVINGTATDEVVVLGNHRDAWIAGGAGDPNSGSATLNELVRGLGQALKAGWKPRRTIVLASWDGEEYGLIGSTEWVEEYLPWLSQSAIAYLNVDVATSGTNLVVSAAPLLDQALIDATKRVPSPAKDASHKTVYDVWNKRIQTMGSGSDFTSFQDYAGIPCVDMSFKAVKSGAQKSAVYHYHSNYDSFDWMDRFGDRTWQYHTTMAKIWGMLAASLVETPIIPFNATNYADALAAYLGAAQEKADALTGKAVKFSKAATAIKELRKAAVALDSRAAHLTSQLADLESATRCKSCSNKDHLYDQVQEVNSRYKYFERKFLFADGLDGRSWFKHTVFAPGMWTGYAGATFPGLVESLDAGDRANAYRWEGIIAQQVHDAAASLRLSGEYE